jgi:hypothetical protein
MSSLHEYYIMQPSHIYTVHVSAVFRGFIMLEFVKISVCSMNALKIAEACTVYTCDSCI